jgi:glycosyltransferase involved in cell wall biosynthesis
MATDPPTPHHDFRPVVLVPTYNNAGTLRAVLDGIAAFDLPMIVVNDGATDATPAVLKDWAAAGPNRTVITHPVNRGKSDAMRTGFAAAADAGFTHALTIDSDGQHDAANIPALLADARDHPTALILGVRGDRIEHCPPNSLKARKVANFLTRVECGQRITDTQSGLRVYPLGLVQAVPCRAGRYGYEAEIIPRAVWAGCPVREVPIACRYFPAEERVSHFQPYRDSLRQLKMHAGLLVRAFSPWPRHPKWPNPRPTSR